MHNLIRLAPWADIEVVRKRMVNAVKRMLKTHYYMNDSYKESYQEFIDGNGHVIPLAYDLDTKLLKILERIADGRHDRRFHDAFNEFLKYFFYTDSQLRLYP